LLTASLGLAAVPVLAQQQGQQPSTGERILRGVLDSLLPPQATPTPTATPAPGVQLTPIEQALAHPRREEERARDAWRHPAETLAFFQVEPGMTVVDYMPATGWYSKILIPYLGDRGTYIGLNPELDASLTGYWDMYRNAASRIPSDAREWVGIDGARVYGANTDDVPSQFHGRADRVLVFREIHNMRRYGWLHDSMLAFRKLLKPDGLVGVVQHRARPGTAVDYTLGDNGYQREQDVIAMFDMYGFDLVARSEINANPNDPANWEGGVWSLPPGMRGAQTDAERQQRMGIGESDRMTLLFRMRP
jgi:predicted methyltransferase